MNDALLRSSPSRPPGGLARPLALVALLMALNSGSDLFSDRFGIETESFASPWKLPTILVGVAASCGGVIGLGCLRWGKQSLRELGWTWEPLGRLVAVGLAVTAVIVGLVVGIYASSAGGLSELCHDMTSLTLGQRAFFAVMGAKNAFVEETLFRGDLQGALARRSRPIVAVMGSSVVFALFHRTLAPIPLAMKLVTGLLFALAAQRTRSLVPSAIGHALSWAILADA